MAMTVTDCPGTLKTDTPDEMLVMVERAREGHRSSFEQLIGIFQDEIFHMIFYRIRSRSDAEDLTQDVCLRAYKNIHRLKNGDRFRSWLFGIAVNLVHDFHRKRQFLRFFTDFHEEINRDEQKTEKTSDNPADRLLNKEFWSHVSNMSSKLCRMEKEVFFLRFMDHLSIKEISQALNKSESTVKTHLYRALKKFKEDDALIEMLQGGEE